MIIEYTANGFINHIRNDPIAPGTVELLAERGILFMVIDGYLQDEDDNIIKPLDIMRFYYIEDEDIVARPTFEDIPDTLQIIANGTDTRTFDIPDPCTVYVDGEKHTVTGGELEIKSDMPAQYEVIIEAWPFITRTIKVTANAP